MALAAGGCGNDEPAAQEERGTAASPPAATVAALAREHAPVVLLHSEERLMPAGADWFLARARLDFAEDHGCPHRLIAVGRTLGEERTDRTNWISTEWLGKDRPTYWRNPNDALCELDFDRRYFTDQHTRPHGGPDREPGIGEREGWYLDLVDGAARGQARPRRAGERTLLEGAPAYFEPGVASVGGAPGLRLSYWLLYAANAPLDRHDNVERERAHEGDWERADVLLRRVEGGRYAPHSLVVHAEDGPARRLPWRDVVRLPSTPSEDPDPKTETHPLLLAARGSHALEASPAERECEECPQWRTWEDLRDAREEGWYGFGGAWGEVGDDDATTGPLGPYGEWPTGAEIAKR
jgi:hypothetical protein